MNKRDTNADKVITGCFVGNYFGTKSSKLRYIEGTIYDTNTVMGKFVEEYDQLKDEYSQFLILTIQNFKIQQTWKTHKKQLTSAASKQDLPVIFVPELDIGFGTEPHIFKGNELLYDELISVAKYSQDEDIKTACAAINRDTGEILAYSYNQLIDNEMRHAEDILCDYLNIIFPGEVMKFDFVSLLEPCYDCLSKMIATGAKNITYGYLHKAHWNTNEYYDLLDEIACKLRLTIYSEPLHYSLEKYDKVNKFYKEAK